MSTFKDSWRHDVAKCGELNPKDCDICAGTGKIAAPEGCACGGTGRAVDAMRYLRSMTYDLRADLARIATDRDRFRDELTAMKAQRAVDDRAMQEMQEQRDLARAELTAEKTAYGEVMAQRNAARDELDKATIERDDARRLMVKVSKANDTLSEAKQKAEADLAEAVDALDDLLRQREGSWTRGSRIVQKHREAIHP